MANEKANAHAALSVLQITAEHIIRTSKEDGSGNNKMFLNNLFPFQAFYGNISQNESVDGGTPTVVTIHNSIEDSPGVGSSWGVAKLGTGLYKLTPSGTWDVDKQIAIPCRNFPVGSIGNVQLFNIRFNEVDSTFLFESGDLSSGHLDDLLLKHGFIILKFP